MRTVGSARRPRVPPAQDARVAGLEAQRRRIGVVTLGPRLVESSPYHPERGSARALDLEPVGPGLGAVDSGRRCRGPAAMSGDRARGRARWIRGSVRAAADRGSAGVTPASRAAAMSWRWPARIRRAVGDRSPRQIAVSARVRCAAPGPGRRSERRRCLRPRQRQRISGARPMSGSHRNQRDHLGGFASSMLLYPSVAIDGGGLASLRSCAGRRRGRRPGPRCDILDPRGARAGPCDRRCSRLIAEARTRPRP